MDFSRIRIALKKILDKFNFEIFDIQNTKTHGGSNRYFIKRKKNSLLDEINTSEIDKRLSVSEQNKWLRIFPNSLNYEGGNDGFFIARIKKIT